MSNVEPIQQQPEQQRYVPLPLRKDNFLGVCEALGQDLHIHANIIRVIFGTVLIFQPLLVVGTYLGLGVLVFLTRWIAPDVRAAAPAAPIDEVQPQAAAQPSVHKQEEVALAA